MDVILEKIIRYEELVSVCFTLIVKFHKCWTNVKEFSLTSISMIDTKKPINSQEGKDINCIEHLHQLPLFKITKCRSSIWYQNILPTMIHRFNNRTIWKVYYLLSWFYYCDSALIFVFIICTSHAFCLESECCVKRNKIVYFVFNKSLIWELIFFCVLWKNIEAIGVSI